MSCPPWCERLAAWLLAHRRLLIGLALFSLAMFAIGYFAPKSSSPAMCKIYG